MYNFIVIGLSVCILMLCGSILSSAITGHFRMFEAQAQKSTPDSAKSKKVTLVAEERSVRVAPDNRLHPGGVIYNAMVFNNTIPGPAIAVDQGDTLQVTLKNNGKVTHSLIFQGVTGSKQAMSDNVKAGGSTTWKLKADHPGVFLYYGGGDQLNNAWEHIANGMYGGIVVHPINELPAKEFYLVFGEIYNNRDKGLFKGTNGTSGSFDITKFLNNQPDLVLTNGMAYKYLPEIGREVILDLNKGAEVFKVKPGELTRWYVVNAGPRGPLNLNFIADTINARDVLFANNNSYSTQLKSYQTWTIPPGSASVIEIVFPLQGSYTGIDHDMGRLLKGAAFAVVATPTSTNYDQPIGTSVPSKSSNTVVSSN